MLDTVGGLIVFTIVMGLTVQVLAWAAAERLGAVRDARQRLGVVRRWEAAVR